MNRGRLGRRYDFKFVTCGSESLRWDPQHEQSIRAIFKQKGSRILKNAMNKIRNGHNNATWIPANVRAALDQHWGSIDFQNKSSIAKANQAIDKGVSTYYGGSISTVAHYEKMSFNGFQVLGRWWRKQKKNNWRMEELQQCAMEASTSANDSSSTSINDDDVYYDIVRGKNGKGSVCGLGRLSNKFICSTRLWPNLIEMSMVE
ncbi:hypothetical protein CR513_10571, partial [Mucuna pruriens]